MSPTAQDSRKTAWREMGERRIHVTVAAVVALAGCVATYFLSDLRKDATSLFGTFSGFVTIYGVAFSIVEVIRAREAAELAASEAKKAAKIVRNLYNIRGLSECQSCIEHALSGLDSDGIAPSSHLSRIIKLYIAEFSSNYADQNSIHRQNVAHIESYVLVRRSSGKANSGQLKAALLRMMADLSVLSGAMTAEENEL